MNIKAALLDFEYINHYQELKTEYSFVKDLGLDSLDAIELTMYIEEIYRVDIPDNEMESIKTIKDLIDCLSKKGVDPNLLVWN
jgi:acyl carrier protein